MGKRFVVTSKAIQNLLDGHQPDSGYLTDRMLAIGDEPIVPAGSVIQLQAEGKISFTRKRDIEGPGVTNADVLAAAESVMPCFEIVDSRINRKMDSKNTKYKIQNTNAPCGLLVLGDGMVSPQRSDLNAVGMVTEKNGVVVNMGSGAVAPGIR